MAANGQIQNKPPADVRVLAFRGSDDELLRRLKQDPKRHAGLLYDRFEGMVNRLVWRLLGADQDHDDVVQEVLFAVLSGVDRVQDAVALEGWVQRVTINTVYSELRRRTAWRVFKRKTQEQGGAVSYSMGSVLESRELLRCAYSQLDGLRPKDRIAFILRYVEQREVRDVASMMGCSLSTVKRHLRRGEQRFVRALEKQPELRILFGDGGLAAPAWEREATADDQGSVR